MLEPIGERPMASPTMPIVLAVNCPAQAPAVGMHVLARAVTSSMVVSPARTRPTASYVSPMCVSRP